MTYTEELVRSEVGRLLRMDYGGKFLCRPCIRKPIRQSLGQWYAKPEIESAARPGLRVAGLAHQHAELPLC